MASPAMKLDTLAYAKKLIAAGCEPKLAEAHASLQQDVLVEISEDYLSQFATHQDIMVVKQDLVMLEQRVDAKIATTATKTVYILGSIVIASSGILLSAIDILLKLHHL